MAGSSRAGSRKGGGGRPAASKPRSRTAGSASSAGLSRSRTSTGGRTASAGKTKSNAGSRPKSSTGKARSASANSCPPTFAGRKCKDCGKKLQLGEPIFRGRPVHRKCGLDEKKFVYKFDCADEEV